MGEHKMHSNWSREGRSLIEMYYSGNYVDATYMHPVQDASADRASVERLSTV